MTDWRPPPLISQVDIYSFGMVLFEMLSGLLPFHGLSPLQVSMAAAKGVRPRVPATCPAALEVRPMPASTFEGLFTAGLNQREMARSVVPRRARGAAYAFLLLRRAIYGMLLVDGRYGRVRPEPKRCG